MKCSIAAICVGITALNSPPAAISADLPEYRAVYRMTTDKAVTGATDYSLSYDSAAAKYTLEVKEFDEKSRLSGMTRTLEFVLVEDGVRPLAYRHNKGTCVACTVGVRFSWQARAAELRYKGVRRVVPLRHDLVDELAELVAMLPGQRELEGFADAIPSESLGVFEITTALGPMKTERRTLRGALTSDVWLAQELAGLPVRIEASARKPSTILELAELQGIAPSAAE